MNTTMKLDDTRESTVTADVIQMMEISYRSAVDFLLPRHYSGRVPSVSVAFGLFVNGVLSAVVTFGKPASPSLCSGVCGKENSGRVYELNRMCRLETYNGQLSEFVAWCLRQLKKNDWIIVSYSDTQMNHHGYVYQACNFLYTGCTKQRTDKYAGNGKHSRHYDKDAVEEYRQIRSAKHRYVYFCTNCKRLKKKWASELRYKVKPYPKGNNSNYTLGEYIHQNIIEVNNAKQDC